MDFKEIPLQKQMGRFTQLLGLLVLVIIIVLLSIFFIQYASDWSYVTAQFSLTLGWLVSLAIAAIPFNFPAHSDNHSIDRGSSFHSKASHHSKSKCS